LQFLLQLTFSGHGDGKIFTLEAKGIEGLGSRDITIEGLR